MSKFHTSFTWEAIRHRGEKVDWVSLVWFKGHTPKHAFHMWVTQQDRLPTRARLATWDPCIDASCLLCDGCAETRDHLFLRCSFSEQVWHLVTKRLSYRPTLFHTWTAFGDWLSSSDSTCPTTLRWLAAQATIYQLSAERINNHLHNTTSSTPQKILNDLDRLIRNSILARKKRRKFRGLMQVWLKHF